MAVELGVGYVTLLPSAKGFEAALDKELSGVGGRAGRSLSGNLADGVEKETKKGGRIGKAFGSMDSLLAGGILGFAGGQALGILADTVGGFISAAEDSRKVAGETAAVIKSTGGAANISAGQIADLAGALAAKTGVDDEVIQSGENVLATFTKVANQAGAGNDIFSQGTAIALDMSSALGTDLQGSVIQVGKALNDPIKGITALQRVGVSFTEDQKKQIEALVATGDTLGAQKIILGELSTEFGGAAEAGATTSGKLSVAWGNIQEQLGTALLPVLDKVANWFLEVLPGATKWVEDTLAELRQFWANWGDEIKAVVGFLFDWIKLEIKIWVTLVKVEFQAISAIVTFLRDWVVNPIISLVSNLADWLGPKIALMVAAVRIAWSGIAEVFSFFRDNVYNPISSAVSDLANGIVRAFNSAVTVVSVVWARIKDVVKAPINVVIGFYNAGIAGLWNFVASKVGLPGLPTIETLNSGGMVPGSGSRDTVPAMLTPGEWVVPKDASRAWGPKILEWFIKGPPKGTADPGILGYAGGGPVRSAEETQAWMRQQVGKPYVFPLAGPNAYDCSGLISALVNFVLGDSNPYHRRHSSGSVGQDWALQRGDGDPNRGLLVGARPPYQTNSQGALVGHETSTVAGVNFEATPPAVRMGGGARGAFALPQHFFMPNFGGLDDDEKGVVAALKSLLGLHVPGLGAGGFGQMIRKLVVDIPKIVFDFLATKVPKIIKDALVETGVAVGGSANPLGTAVGVVRSVLPFMGDGGRIGRDGPVLVGDRGPEILWGSRGQYVQANAAARPVAAASLMSVGAIFGDREFQRMVEETVANMEFRTRGGPRP